LSDKLKSPGYYSYIRRNIKTKPKPRAEQAALVKREHELPIAPWFKRSAVLSVQNKNLPGQASGHI